eukprot:5445559-Amphidinium_carterae.1
MFTVAVTSTGQEFSEALEEYSFVLHASCGKLETDLDFPRWSQCRHKQRLPMVYPAIPDTCTKRTDMND